MKSFRASLALLLVLALTGCSQRWRDADPGLDASQVEELLAESLAAVTLQSAIIPQDDTDRFETLLSDPNTTIYFAESNPDMGEPKNVAPFLDWRFLGQQAKAQNGGEVFSDQITYARIFFLDLAYEGSSSENALLIDIKVGDRRVVKIFFNDQFTTEVERSYFENGEFVSHMTSSDGSQIVIRSFDVLDDQLQSVIQLEVYDFIENGKESFAGKFSTLVAFGPK